MTTTKKTGTEIKKKKLREKRIIIALLAVFVGVAGFSGYKIISIMSDYNTSETEYEGLNKDVVEKIETIDPVTNEESPYLDINHEGLKKKNPDYVGWLYIPGTNISYPMVLGDTNDEYLHKTFEGKYAYAGSLFLDYRNKADFSDTNTVVYGHHMNNNSMFTQLDLFQNWEFGTKNNVFHIYRDNKVYIYQNYCFILTSSTGYAYTFNFATQRDYANHLATLKTEQYYETGVRADVTKPIVTLSTCQGINTGRRYVLVGILKEVIDMNDIRNH